MRGRFWAGGCWVPQPSTDAASCVPNTKIRPAAAAKPTHFILPGLAFFTWTPIRATSMAIAKMANAGPDPADAAGATVTVTLAVDERPSVSVITNLTK